MARGTIMLQLAVEQVASPAVTSAPEIWAVAVDNLDGDTTTVREIATEKIGFFHGNGHVSPALDISGTSALTDLFLAFEGARRPLTVLHAPSHVPSPPFEGARIVILRVRDFGFSIPSPGTFVWGRLVGSHAYLDEV
jgi:hypothetical protein